MTDESVQGRPDDAGVFAATALALGQALAEIATMVGLNPDDGELYPITDRVRRIADEHQKWADAIAETAVRLSDAGYHGQLVDSVVRLIADRQWWVREAFRLAERAGWVSFGSHANNPDVELELDGKDVAGMPLWERPKSCRPATVEAAPPPLCEKCRCRGVQDPSQPGSVFGHFCLNCIGACHDMSDESSIHMCVIDRWTPSAAGVSGTGTEASDA